MPYFFQRTGYDAAEIDTPVWYPDREAGTAVGEVIAGTRDWTGSVSPPVICRDVVVVGSSGMDWRLGRDQPVLVPPGDVRGFDVRTGAMVWTFHSIPHDGEFGADTGSPGPGRSTGPCLVHDDRR